jgi:N-acetylneuraminic acid mutarotase
VVLLVLVLSLALPIGAAASEGRSPERAAAVAASDVSATGSTADGTWLKLTTSGPRPSERSTPAVAALGTSVYVFGGVKDDFSTQINTFYNDLHRFDTLTNTWLALSPAGALPPARAFAASVGHERSRRMLVFGGAIYGPFFVGFTAYDDLWAYSVDQNAWSQIHPLNPGPVGRSRPTAWIVDGKMYIFGGVTSTFTTLNDLWVYNLNTNTWTQLIPNGAPGSPPPRHEAQAGTVPARGRLTLYGGEGIDPMSGGFVTLDDTWEFDLNTNTWSEVTPAPQNNIQPPRNYGAAAVIEGNLYLQGGDVPGGSSGCGAPFPQNPTEELWRFDLVQHVWTRLFPAGDPLVALKRHNAAVVGSRMYIFSGWDFQCEGGVGPGQVWNLDVYRYEPSS